MKELKTYRDLYQAILDGHVIEYWSEYLREWIPSFGRMPFDIRELDKDIICKYRVKPTKPSIDWSQVNEKYHYLARDEDGRVYLYEDKPEIDNRYSWWNTGYEDYISANVFKSLNVGTCDWKDSLVKRPKE